jgi:heat shock protein HtpX
MERLSFEDEIARNRRSSILLAIILAIMILFLVFTLTYVLAPEYLLFILPITILIIVGHTYTSYMHGDRIVLASTGALLAEGREYTYLRDTVEGLSIAAGIPAPQVYIIPSEEMNAFATGRDAEHASVAVTRGLISRLDRQELEGVVAHEISHIRNRDILFMTLVAVLVGLTAIISHIILRSFWYGGSRAVKRRRRDREGGSIEMLILIVGFILAIFAPIATRLVQLAVSRKREYLADASGAELTRYPEGLASALEKMIKTNQGKMDVSEAVSHLFLVDPNRSALDALYATHPPIEERIRRLRVM